MTMNGVCIGRMWLMSTISVATENACRMKGADDD